MKSQVFKACAARCRIQHFVPFCAGQTADAAAVTDLHSSDPPRGIPNYLQIPMKVFHAPASLLHAPATYFRRGKAIPHLEQPARYDILLKAATAAGHQINAATPHGIEALKRVHSERYLAFLEQAWPRRAEIEAGLDYVLPSHFSRPEMSHYPQGIIGQVGFHMADLSTPIHEHTYQAIRGSADAALSAAEAAVEHGYAYSLCRPPGHHASTESAGGFCFINNTALAAAHLRHQLGCKVGIIDIDVHHGNGTQNSSISAMMWSPPPSTPTRRASCPITPVMATRKARAPVQAST